MTTGDAPRPAAGNAPDRKLAGMSHVDVPDVELTAELAERRAAVAELGEALRDLSSQAIGSAWSHWLGQPAPWLKRRQLSI